MTHIWQAAWRRIRHGVRSGAWLTPARARGYSLILLGVCAIAISGWIALSDGLIDRNGKPLGTDFSNVYAAGTLTWQGRPADAYVPALQHAAEKAVFGGREVPFYGWHYAVLRGRRSGGRGSLWLASACGELCRLLAVMRAILPPETADRGGLPAVFVNLGHGRTDFSPRHCSAALLADRRPPGVRSAASPQAAIRRVIPVALLAGGRWAPSRRSPPAALVVVSFPRSAASGTFVHEFHAGGGARTGRHRLGEDSIGVFGGADVGRRRSVSLCRAARAGADAWR
jgi:hypothetical protein